MKKRIMKKHPLQILLIYVALAIAIPSLGQRLLAQQSSGPSAYTPKFPGDPARSDSEAGRPRLYARRSPRPAPLRETIRPLRHIPRGTRPLRLVHQTHGRSQSRRLYRQLPRQEDSFILTMTPQHLDAQHRSFYAEDDGKIYADEEKPCRR